MFHVPGFIDGRFSGNMEHPGTFRNIPEHPGTSNNYANDENNM